MKKLLILAGIACVLINCSINEPIAKQGITHFSGVSKLHLSEVISVTGIKYAEATIAMQAAYNRFIKDLNEIEAITIVAEVDHQRNAKSVGLELEPLRIVFFGNPALGTPLMQQNQLAGLDLPQKILFFRDEQNNDFAIYNSVDYLSSRHGLEGVSTLEQISFALENLVSEATKSEVVDSNIQNVAEGEGIITKESNQNFSDTYATLKSAIASNPNLKVVADLDHQANAASVDMALRPTRIIIFGNPNLGTPLMQDQQTVGLDLPQKMLVWEDENGVVKVSYNSPNYLMQRHNLDMSDEQINTISAALDNLSNVATGM